MNHYFEIFIKHGYYIQFLCSVFLGFALGIISIINGWYYKANYLLIIFLINVFCFELLLVIEILRSFDLFNIVFGQIGAVIGSFLFIYIAKKNLK